MTEERGGKRPALGALKQKTKEQRGWYTERWYEVVTAKDHDAIIRQVVGEARKGKEWAVKLYLDRVQGKVPQPVDLKGDPDQPLHIVNITTDGERRSADNPD